MAKAIIFDFMGVIADFDYISFFNELPLSCKLNGLKIVSAISTNPEIKKAFSAYQKGQIDRKTFECLIQIYHPKAASALPKLLDRLPSYIHSNQKVISLAKSLRESGVRTFIISNSIPETENLIVKACKSGAFEGAILSHKIGVKKPSS